MTSSADNILKRFENLESRRGEWDGIWQQCSDFVLPRLGANNKKNNRIFDSTAPLALGHFAAAMESILVPRTQKWHSFVTGDPELDQSPEVAEWLEAVRNIVFAARYAPEANFANQMTEAFLSLGVVGTAVIYIDDLVGRGLRYHCVPTHEIYLATDFSGRPDTVFRLYTLTARQAVEQFGAEDLPANISKDAGDPVQMERVYEFVHGVFPRADFEPGQVGAENLPVASVHIARAARKVVRESGYRTMPYAVSRFSVTPGEIYGRSPAMDVMPDIVQVNAMKMTLIRAAERMVEPPVLAGEDDVLSAFSLKAGAINFGGLDEQGRQRVVPFQINGNLPVGLEMIESSRKVINEAYYINLFQILVEQSGQRTATEVLQKAAEQAQLLAPVAGRLQSELLWTIINREVDILEEARAFPEPPPNLAERLGAAAINPKYETALAQALSSREGQSIIQALEALAPLAGFDPAAAKLVDAVEAGRVVWTAFGAPSRLLRDEEEMTQMQEAAAEQQAQAVALEQAGQLAGGLGSLAGADKNLAEAASMGGGLMNGLMGGGVV